MVWSEPLVAMPGKPSSLPPLPARLRTWLVPTRPSAWAMLVFAVGLLIAANVLVWINADPMTTGRVLGICALPLGGLILRRLGFDYGTIAIILVGFVLYGFYLTYTGHGDRNHDGSAQLKYVRYIAENKAFPPASHCFICHHPPLYYALAAGAYRLCEVTHLAPPIRGAQVFSLLTFFFFLVFAIKTVGRFTTRAPVIRLAAAFFVFWPYSVINSVRLHNDVFISMLLTGGLYFLVRWQQEGRLRDMLLVVLMCILGVFTKSSAYILVAALGLVAAFKFFREPERWRFFKGTAPILVTLAAVLLLHMWMRGQESSVTEGLLGSAYEVKGYVANNPHAYLYFDLENFLKEPYILARVDGTGRQLYWNHLIKSSLFATHNRVADAETAYILNRHIATVMNFLALAMIAYVLSGLLFFRKDRVERYLAVIITTLLFVLFHMAFRILVPAPHHTDFRFIYPVLVSGTLAFTLTMDGYRERGLALQAFAYVFAVPFFVLSAAYFIPKHDFVQDHLPPSIIEKDLAEFEKVVPERTKWDADGNFILPRDSVLELDAGGMTVKSLDISMDHNDRYKVTLAGRTSSRELHLGPSDKKLTGLARYRETFEPPLRGVRTITIEPEKGDHMYAIGHVIAK